MASNVLLVGAGGVGAIAALNLQTGGKANVTVVLRSTYEIVSNKGFRIDSVDHGLFPSWKPHKVLDHVPAHPSESEQPFDYIVLSVKNIPDIGQNLPDLIRPAVKDAHTVIVLIQNGLNIEKPFFAAFPSNIVISGVSAIDSHELEPGWIHQGQPDELYIGPFHNPNLAVEAEEKAAHDFMDLYGAAGKTDCRYSNDVPWARWRKLVYNASWNPICAMTELDTGSIRLIDGMVDNLVRPVMQEVVATANALGHTFRQGMIEQMIESDPIDQRIKPSMQIDVEKGRYIEYENIVGEAMREAKLAGVSTPKLETIYEMCKAYQWKLGLKKGEKTLTTPSNTESQ